MINFCWNVTHKREEKNQTVYEKLESRIEQLVEHRKVGEQKAKNKET